MKDILNKIIKARKSKYAHLGKLKSKGSEPTKIKGSEWQWASGKPKVKK